MAVGGMAGEGFGFRASMGMVGVTKLLNVFGWMLLCALLCDLFLFSDAAHAHAQLRGGEGQGQGQGQGQGLRRARASGSGGGFLATYADDWKDGGGTKGTMMLDINKAMSSAAESNGKSQNQHEPKWSYEQASQWQSLDDPASPLFKAGFNKWHTSTDGLRFTDGHRQVDCKATKPVVHDMRFKCDEMKKMQMKGGTAARKLLQMPDTDFKTFVGVSNVAHGDDGMPVWNSHVPTPPGYVPSPYSQTTHPAIAPATVLQAPVLHTPNTLQPVAHNTGTTINIVSGRKLLMKSPEEFKAMLGVSNVAHGDDGMPVWTYQTPGGRGWLPSNYMYSAMNMQGYWGCGSLTATGRCQGDPAYLGGYAVHGIHQPLLVPQQHGPVLVHSTQHALQPSTGDVTINVNV